MSQQVGYADASEMPAHALTRNRSSDAAAKQILKRQLSEAAAAGQQQRRRGPGAGAAARSADPLADLL
jgi:hypothetical protein